MEEVREEPWNKLGVSHSHGSSLLQSQTVLHQLLIQSSLTIKVTSVILVALMILDFIYPVEVIVPTPICPHSYLLPYFLH